ncbi:metallopeptidase TldD-related protein [Oceanirhabdus sp. W0125-5]|uniref:metallopeptidase TldD-related protein n=1 Tax=Oceanirhabdus sp. W0125-5 TaxID=2999116 RepID=UPI0022F33081|nr:metallopeptidase TldD-related protein [Oceanirhabdus sp. W0125-5]WBW97123.1 metallopeptidase TldD-related protein [Oceanirhabdus sp. W0125-5]
MLKEKLVNKLKETAINIVNSEIESIREKNITKTGLRVYENGKIGIAGAIGKYDEKELEKEAIESLSENIKYECDLCGNRSEVIDKRREIINDEDFIKEMEDVITQIKDEQSEFSFFGKVLITETANTLSNDKNLNLEYRDKSLGIGLAFKEKTSTNIMDVVFDCDGRNYDRKLLIDEINMILDGYKNKVELPEEKTYPVAFLPSNSGIFRKFVSDLHGEMFGSGTSLLSNKLGEKVFNEEFTLYKSLNPEDVLNIPFFDTEGIVNKDYRYALIENGVVKAPYTDKKTAKTFNLPQTGSAEGDYYDVPGISLNPYSLFKIKESEKIIKELLAGDMGVLVLYSAGGDFAADGNFATPVQVAMLFDGERIIGRLPEIQVSSNIFHMFGDSFRGVSKDNFFPLSEDKLIVMDMKVSKI